MNKLILQLGIKRVHVRECLMVDASTNIDAGEGVGLGDTDDDLRRLKAALDRAEISLKIREVEAQELRDRSC